MLIKPPQVGQTYVSRIKPELMVYVVDVVHEQNDDSADPGFIVEACDPTYKDDTHNADGYDITDDVWLKHDFVLVAD
ncbi:MAG: hypothetical protein WA632_02735 [Gallionella sp.]